MITTQNLVIKYTVLKFSYRSIRQNVLSSNQIYRNKNLIDFTKQYHYFTHSSTVIGKKIELLNCLPLDSAVCVNCLQSYCSQIEFISTPHYLPPTNCSITSGLSEVIDLELSPAECILKNENKKN